MQPSIYQICLCQLVIQNLLWNWNFLWKDIPELLDTQLLLRTLELPDRQLPPLLLPPPTMWPLPLLAVVHEPRLLKPLSLRLCGSIRPLPPVFVGLKRALCGWCWVVMGPGAGSCNLCCWEEWFSTGKRSGFWLLNWCVVVEDEFGELFADDFVWLTTQDWEDAETPVLKLELEELFPTAELGEDEK